MNHNLLYRDKITKSALAVFLYIVGLCNATAQDTLTPPHLRRATIDLETQRYRLDWDIPADTSKVVYYRIGRRVERATGGYVYDENELVYAYNRETSYMRFPDRWGCCFPQAFAINSMPKNIGVDFMEWSEGYQTMYQYPIKLDTCEQSVELTWTPYNRINSYTLYPTDFERTQTYLVYVFEDSVYDIARRMRYWGSNGNVSQGSNRVFKMEKVEGRHKYYFVIATVYNEGRDTSFSNIQMVEYDFLTHPVIRLDSVISTEEMNKIYFNINVTTQYSDFILERSVKSDSAEFVEVARFDKYTRAAYDTTAGGQAYFYRVSATKDCGAIIKSSPVVAALALKLTAREAQNILRWNAIHDAPKSSSVFTLYRTSPSEIVISSDENISAIDYESAMYSSQAYCYYVEGVAADSFGRQIAYVRSATVCYEAVSVWFMPNAVSPFSAQSNSETGIHRNQFRPICDHPHTFLLKIFDRWGNEVYSGNNTGWNGQDNKMGATIPEATYTYWVQIIFKNGKKEEKVGNVTVVWSD